jgi:hypothetical protein
MGLAGDNPIVDFDLSGEYSPARSNLRIGNSVVLERAAIAGNGRGQFARRFGVRVREFVSGKRLAGVQLCGHDALVISAGMLRAGEVVAKCSWRSLRAGHP